MPLISIVIPLYNKERFIKETLDSVFNQSFTDYEIIIVNDGSTDSSVFIVNAIEDQRITVLSNQNKGVSHARNFGISKANSDLIALLDGDDLWEPNHLENLYNLYEKFPDCGLYATAYNKKYFNGEKIKASYNGLAKEYFGISANKIEVLVHPESLIHALVGFNDGALIAHVGPTDMRHAIGYALHWPKRQPLPVERLDFARIGTFSFRAPDEKRWPALRLAREVMERGGLAGTVFNAAKEVALNGFVSGDISFINMAEIVDKVLNSVAVDHIDAPMTLDNIMYVDQISRNAAINEIKQRAG